MTDAARQTTGGDAAAGPQAHVLLVDDDERIRGLLQTFLVRNGYLVTVGRDAAHARRLLVGLDFDLLILDVMMPGEDGISLTAGLRAARAALPVLLLTAKGETEDRIAGLEAGADDYLTKPFEPRELLLRMKAILRRAPVGGDGKAGILQLGPRRYDPDRGELTQGGEAVRLTATESAMMQILAATPNEAVPRHALVERLHRADGEASSERAVDVQVTRLRRKLEPDPRQPRYLQTVRGEGYMLAPD